MKFTGYIDGEKVTFALNDAGRHEEYYTDDSYFTIRDMLNRDGVRNLMDA